MKTRKVYSKNINTLRSLIKQCVHWVLRYWNSDTSMYMLDVRVYAKVYVTLTISHSLTFSLEMDA